MENPQEQFERYKRIERALGTKGFASELIHYTSLSKLAAILDSGTLWFGRLSEMNDTAEGDHFLQGMVGAAVELFPQMPLPVIEGLLCECRKPLREETFISSWCEYEDPDGVLSMWRSYASGDEGLGIVVDAQQFQPASLKPETIGFFLNISRIEYVRAGEAISIARRVVSQLAGSRDLSFADRIVLLASLLAKAACVKHHSFAEEKEIRFLSTGGLTAAMQKIIPVERPFPDIELKRLGERSYLPIELKNYPHNSLDLSVERLFKKVVIAPGGDKQRRIEKVRKLLDARGLMRVGIDASSIPLR